MKIALINNLHGQYRRGGAETIVDTLEQSLKQQGHDIIIISTRPAWLGFLATKQIGNAYYLPSAYYYLNKLPIFLRAFWHVYKFVEPFTFCKLKKILKQEKVDLVLSHNMLGFCWLSFWMIRLLNIKQTHYLHDTQLLHPAGRLLYKQEGQLNDGMAKIYQSLQRLMTQPVQYVVSPSQWLLQLHKDRGFFRSASTVNILNPIDKPQTSSTQKNKEFTFLYLGQVDQAKGINLLMQAFAKIKDNHTCKLVVTGSGKLLTKLKNDYQDDSIKFLGQVSPDKVPNLLQSSHCLVLPSLIYENLPTSLLSALSYKLPIIASSLGGSKEIVKQFGGHLFKPNNVNDLVEQMETVINNPSQIKTKGLEDLWSENYIDKLNKFLNLS